MRKSIERFGMSGVKEPRTRENLSDLINEVPDVRSVRGEFFDTLINIRTGEEKVLHYKAPNLIVTDFSKLIAGLLSNQSGYSGLAYWAIGRGEGTSWDSLSTTARQAKSVSTLTKLYNEITRKTVAAVYLDTNDDVTASVTGKLQLSATFGTDVSGHLREFGVFGGPATATADSGVMINHRAHAVIALNVDTDEMILSRILWLTL